MKLPYCKRKFVGGNKFGNMFDIANNFFSSISKFLIEELPFTRKLVTKADAGIVEFKVKQFRNKAIMKVTEGVKLVPAKSKAVKQISLRQNARVQ